MGLYLGPSPAHNKNVALVMDIDTGLVSPQFHVMFDNDFQTIDDKDKITPLWKVKTGLVSERELEQTKRENDKMPVVIPGLEIKTGRREGGREEKNTLRSAKRTKLATEEEENKIKSKPKVREDINLRRLPRLNPHLQAATELLSLQTIISQRHESPKKG